MKKYLKLFTILLLIVLNLNIYAQNKPYPQNVTYPYGFKPVNITSKLAQDEYERWKNLYLVPCNDYLMPLVDGNNTNSFSIGISMLIAAYEGDKITYDKLLNFYKSKRRASENYMMPWKVTCDTAYEKLSATNGEIDIAFSLIIAHIQWGETYLDDAKAIIQILKNSVITNCSGTLALKYGYYNGRYGGCNEMSMSYYTPAFFRIFAQVTNDPLWTQLAYDTYILLYRSTNTNTGLIPDWQTSNGGSSSSLSFNYGYDACIVPFRIALDYLWNGNTDAQKWCTRITNWARKIGTSNIKDGYVIDGTPTGAYNNSSFVGSFAVGAMCNNQTLVDTFGIRLNQFSESDPFNLATRIIYLHVLTGNFWKPDLSTNIHSRTKSQIKLFPNPASNQIIIDGIQNCKKYEIIEFSGKILKFGQIQTADKIIIDVSSLKRGSYIVRMTDKSGAIKFFKFIKLLN